MSECTCEVCEKFKRELQGTTVMPTVFMVQGTTVMPTVIINSKPFVAADVPLPDYHGPNDAAHKAVHDVVDHLVNGRVTSPPARKRLREALDKADAPPTGRKASDQAMGRALRFS